MEGLTKRQEAEYLRRLWAMDYLLRLCNEEQINFHTEAILAEVRSKY